MKVLVFYGAGAATAVACASMALVSAGVAAADPDVVGKSYADAKGVFSAAGLTPRVATVVGDQLPQNQCFVASTSKPTFLDQAGASKGDMILVNLNCYPRQASAVNPGYSAGNHAPAVVAIRATQDEQSKEWMGTPEGQKWCHEALQEHPDWGSIPGC